MLHFLETCVWAGVVGYGIWRMALVLDRFAPVPTRASGKTADEEVAVPPDLVAVAMMESEPWAQDDMMRVIRERYRTFGDWNRVRAAVGVAPE